MTPPSPTISRVRTSVFEPAKAIDRTFPEFPAAQPIDENNYFKKHKPPPYLSEISKDVANFIASHNKQNRKVVLVTSGGTTVPLENNTVRFIDNFSAGTRGATSAEYFLENGYAVIFLHREFSLLPYSRHYSHTTNCFLDYMNEDENGQVVINAEYQNEMRVVLRKYQNARDKGLLLVVPFTTVHQYLFTLKLVSQELSVIGPNGLFYLAAAVSDFFLPHSRMPEHKIQSQNDNDGKLRVSLEAVPKFLSRLVDSWAPLAMIISFKLETDSNILLSKARGALERYNHQLVIGNLLQTRKKEVVFVTPEEGEHWIRLTDEQHANGTEIESLIIPEIMSLHEKWCEKTSTL
ncbi:hypothetical protein LJB42_004250 [Komagataella kurtzmanii]|nr:hypothetical protein LJB42_004250 [Komagataella kurtzmanii]